MLEFICDQLLFLLLLLELNLIRSVIWVYNWRANVDDVWLLMFLPTNHLLLHLLDSFSIVIDVMRHIDTLIEKVVFLPRNYC